MATKAKKQNKKSSTKKMPENMLPQNILPVGERVEENKNIYISQSAYKQIHKFTQNKTKNESGGMLVGTVVEEFGKTNIIISGFIEAKFCEATPTTLKFTHETWDCVHKELEKKHQGQKIVGWIHTHPDFGIFLSEYDKFIHQNFFSEDYQVAYVVDPVQNIEGFYFWINGNIEKCKGFCIYEKNGVRITVDVEKEKPVEEQKTRGSGFKNFMIAVLSVLVIFLLLSYIKVDKKLNQMEKEQEKLEMQQIGIAQNLYWLQQENASQAEEIEQLKEALKAAEILVEPLVPEDNTSTDTETDEPTDVTDEDEPTNAAEGDTTENE